MEAGNGILAPHQNTSLLYPSNSSYNYEVKLCVSLGPFKELQFDIVNDQTMLTNPYMATPFFFFSILIPKHTTQG